MLKLLSIGDIALCGDYQNIIATKGYSFPLKRVADCFREADVVIGNLEVPHSEEGSPDSSKIMSLCGPPAGIKALKTGGLTHVSLANNHIYDYGLKAARDTRRRLREIGIETLGTGDNLKEARKPVIFSRRGISIFFLAYNSYTTNGRHYAKANQEGVAPLEYRYIKEDIDIIKFKYKSPVIVISLHWGMEGEPYPLPFQVELAHRVIDDGASIIVGHHSHVVQGIERYGGGLIAYSHGNFCFPDVSSPFIEGVRVKQRRENKQSFVLDCDLDLTGVVKCSWIPLVLNNDLQPCLDIDSENENILQKLEDLSRPLQGDERSYRRFYEKIKSENLQSFSRRLRRLAQRHSFRELKSRLNTSYLKAHLIALLLRCKEARHRRDFYAKTD